MLKSVLAMCGMPGLSWFPYYPWSQAWTQGDQFGRIFDFCAIVYVVRIFKNHRSRSNFWPTSFRGKRYAYILAKKWVGLHFGRFVHKLISSPCLDFKNIRSTSHSKDKIASQNFFLLRNENFISRPDLIFL
jgi:hypothetical protein